MSNKNSIHDFDVNLIVEYYSNTERQGCGSPDVTLKALSFIDNLSSYSHIADIGCGTGGQTMVLASQFEGKITGVDLFPTFVDLFNRNAEQLNLHNRVKCIVGSMDNLQFKNEELDIINELGKPLFGESGYAVDKAGLSKRGVAFTTMIKKAILNKEYFFNTNFQ